VSSHPSRPLRARLTRARGRGLSARRPTWSSAGSVIAPAWPCTGWGLPGRRVAAAPVRSYRTISPLPAPGSREARRLGGVFLWHFPAGFPGSVPRPPCPAVSGLSSRDRLSPRPPRGCLAGSTSMVGRGTPAVERPGAERLVLNSGVHRSPRILHRRRGGPFAHHRGDTQPPHQRVGPATPSATSPRGSCVRHPAGRRVTAPAPARRVTAAHPKAGRSGRAAWRSWQPPEYTHDAPKHLDVAA
jgi:hypothetical protein